MTRKALQPYQETVVRRQTSPGLIVLCALVLFLISSQLVLLSKCAAGAVKNCGSDSPSPVPDAEKPVLRVVTPSSWYIDTGFRQNRCVGSKSPFTEPRANLSDPNTLRARIGDKFKTPGREEITFDKHYTVSLKLSEGDVQNHLDTVCTLLKIPGARGFQDQRKRIATMYLAFFQTLLAMFQFLVNIGMMGCSAGPDSSLHIFCPFDFQSSNTHEAPSPVSSTPEPQPVADEDSCECSMPPHYVPPGTNEAMWNTRGVSLQAKGKLFIEAGRQAYHRYWVIRLHEGASEAQVRSHMNRVSRLVGGGCGKGYIKEAPRVDGECGSCGLHYVAALDDKTRDYVAKMGIVYRIHPLYKRS
ncbi:hypothetical protein CkaCkLH20_08965 [Colletotrichum karsti]|uniref:Uncharacterized protein n=1 Tax=Colletotrichum karsti TaxID=1095194 RepID=A0A9P6I233_9PEZI|nr:uncharacterized protein CkaCkLH20_08965 [Colletotrichum karsti]KAF9873506.1 hypothetical protein CkaCkLH20_08965 [Colletotrichum karsti]